jgi:anti-sigma regulatory factor (Ser/Thr protein kinase)
MTAAAHAVPRAVCVTGSLQLRRTLRRTLGAVGSQVEFHDSPDAVPAGETALVVIDGATRRALAPGQLEALAGSAGLIVLGDSIEHDDVVAMLRGRGVDHVIADADEPDDTEIVVTSVKLLSGDLFGLEKYLAWGVRVGERVVRTYEAKREAMGEVTGYAKEVGARRPVIAKIESVVDELLMNALYDAPAAAGGTRPPPVTGNNEPPPEARAVLRWACDGRYFAVSVEDAFGALRKDAIVEHLARARSERGRPRPGHEGNGAGLGLYFILSSVTRFVANIEPGKRTEVVCLFDLKQAGRDADACARSLHVFGA